MPGTGKTTTVSKIINYLINNCEQTVLITGYTHSSVDNILLKLLEGGVDFLRLGNIEKVLKKADAALNLFSENLDRQAYSAILLK